MPSRQSVTPLLRIVLFVLTGLLFSSCAVTEYLGAYFNTYYNARAKFDLAEEEVWNQPEIKLSGRNLLLVTTIPAGAKEKFVVVIEKCSKLLQYHQESSLVDDALLMIAEAYYYVGDYTQSERKCRELMDTYPNSGLLLDGEVFLSYDLYRQNKIDEALAMASQVLERAVTAGDAKSEAYAEMLIGQIRQEQKNYTAAAEYFTKAGRKGSTADFRTTAFLTTGDMYMNVGDSTLALAAYTRGSEESNNYSTEYRSKLGIAKSLSKLHRGKEALDLLQRLRKNANFKEMWGEIDVEIGNAYLGLGEVDNAMEEYEYVDSSYARSAWSAAADLELGMLYEKKFGMLDSARAVYGRGRTGGASTIAGVKVAAKSDLLNRLWSIRQVVASTDTSIQECIQASDTGAASSGRDSSVSRTDSTGRGKRSTAKVKIPLDTLNARMASAMNELATLYLVGFSRPESTMVWDDSLMARFPQTSLSVRVWYTKAQALVMLDSLGTRRDVDSLYHLILDRYPTTEFAAAARKSLGLPPLVAEVDPAFTSYERAEKFLVPGSYETAVDSFRAVVTHYPKSPMAAQAEYAIGWIYQEQLSLPDSAVATYQVLAASYPSSPYAATVRPILDAAKRAKASQDTAKSSVRSINDTTKGRPALVPTREELPKPIPDVLPVKSETPSRVPLKAPSAPDSTLRKRKDME